jgi:hypothetical protein
MSKSVSTSISVSSIQGELQLILQQSERWTNDPIFCIKETRRLLYQLDSTRNFNGHQSLKRHEGIPSYDISSYDPLLTLYEWLQTDNAIKSGEASSSIERDIAPISSKWVVNSCASLPDSDQQRGNCLSCTTTINEGDLVLTIPRNFILSAKFGMSENNNNFMSQ